MSASPLLFTVSLLDNIYLRVYENGYVAISVDSSNLHRAKRDRIDDPRRVARELLRYSDPDANRVRIEFANGQVRYYDNIPKILLPVYFEMANPTDEELRELRDIPAILEEAGGGYIILHYNDLMEYRNPIQDFYAIVDVDYLDITGNAVWTPRFQSDDVDELIANINIEYNR